jgi:hypothetical protein
MLEVIERGRVYFFYRPRVEKRKVQQLKDVQRLLVVLSADPGKLYRTLVIGRKRLPDPKEAGLKKFWGFVQRVSTDPAPVQEILAAETYPTKTRGRRHQGSARPAGEGSYSFVKHDSHAHLVYTLQFPKEPGEVQTAFNINREASYIIAVKDTDAAWLQDTRFKPLQNPNELQEGAEIVLISASADISEEFGKDFEREGLDTATLFEDLRILEADHPPDALISGRWA